MNKDEIKKLDQEYIMPTYGRYDVCFTHGKGVFLYDGEGREYVDFASGIGVTCLGYGNPAWVAAVSRQAQTLSHVSNLFYTEPCVKAAKKLTELSGMSNVFFANSGTEANEGAIKLARKYSHDKYGKGRSTIVGLSQSFHGRTLASLSATGQEALHDHFFPFVDGFRWAVPNDLDSLKAAVDGQVCAILLEGVQGEGGVLPLTQEFVKGAFALAKEKDVLLIFDEVQTGVGRTGDFYSYQGLGVLPDIVTTAKGLGGGLPIAGVLAGEACKEVLGPGTHGATYGANPICSAGALAVLDIVGQPDFLKEVKAKGEFIMDTVSAWNLPAVKEVRGKGLMIGIQLASAEPKEVVKALLAQGLVTLTAGKDVLRLLPPLVVNRGEIERGLEILKEGLNHF